jgi:hypothetical protein
MFCLEVPNETGADEQIVLAAPVSGHIRLWHTRPEVSHFSAQTEFIEEPHI